MKPTRALHRPARQARSRKTLDALLAAAEQLIERKSFAEISLSELVRVAGVTTGAFYNRFESKNELLPILYQRYLVWLRGVVDEELAPSPWRGLSRSECTARAADFICRLYETRGGLLRAMVIFSRQEPRAVADDVLDAGAATPPQLLLIRRLCERLEDPLAPENRPARDELEFAVYSAITLARETILFPGLPMARALELDPQRIRARLARLLDVTLTKEGPDRS